MTERRSETAATANSLGRNLLSDRAFHLQLDQALQLDAVFHRELADEIVDETVHAQAHGLRFGQAALLHVEDLFGAHLADAGFVLHGVAGAADGDGRISVGAAGRVDQKRVALGVVLAILQMLRHVHEAAISGATFADGDRFRNDVAGRFIGGVNHLRAGVLVLAVVGQRDGKNFAARLATFHDHAGIFHGQARADVAVDPFDLGVFVREAAFGHEIEDVGRPVLHGDVLNLRALERDQFDDRAVQGGGVELRRGAAFHVGHFRAFIGDDEGALELAEVFGVDAEVSLQRMFHFHAGRDVDERAAAEHGGVQRAEFVVAGRDDFAEPFPENFRMILQAFGRSDEDDALFADGLLDVGIDGFAVELRFDAGEKFSFLLRNTEPLEGALDVVRHILPAAFRLGAGAESSSGSYRNRSLRDPCSPNASASVFPRNVLRP